MSIVLLLVVSLIFSAVALPTQNLKGNERSLVRKSRDVGLGFGISGSINGYAGYNDYDYGYYGNGRPWNYGYDGLLNNGGYGGIYGGVVDGYGYSPDYYDYHNHHQHHHHHHNHNEYEYGYDRFNQYHYHY